MSLPKSPSAPNLSRSAPSLPGAQVASDPRRRKGLVPSPLRADGSSTATTATTTTTAAAGAGAGMAGSSHGAAAAAATRPAFAPFFTLIEDATTGRHVHPAVHYIFSDDEETELLTEASLHALSALSCPSPPPPPPQRLPPDGSGGSGSHRRRALRSSEDGSSSSTSSRSARQAGPSPVRHRYLIVDVGADGETVTAVRSLANDWQPLGADISQAPTWDAGTPAAAADDAAATTGAGAPQPQAQKSSGGLMLRIEGTEALAVGVGHESDGAAWDVPPDAEGEEQAMTEMMELFEKRMATLRKMLDVGERTIRLE
ncbi:MAG: ubiquitin-protein ligase Anaphase Promoting Complex [Phylliscum demangeonii]|nr:MAG: ubiquitin-protein ligase Anaphase Promoting Complex [Phylliscum demangeonii]